MRELARPFLDRKSYEVILPEWRQRLINIKNSGMTTSQNWSISKGSPIKTDVSIGEYEQGDRKGKHSVFGQISGTWEIRLPNADDKKVKDIPNSFMLIGLASTAVSMWSADEEPAVELARWTIDIGDTVSPGCHFHTQIDLDDPDGMFPKSLSVPRLPALLHTPMDALEFLLAELFQKRWYEHSSRETNPVRTWSHCQRRRLSKLLDWQHQALTSTSGSPWTMFKRKKPSMDMFF